ncbi:methylsterol monooxygenase 1-1-like [Melia azedarach]|uniref:Methylsterol monooxygenase 1-1-like n=1 Tax=Melia azedarach TaxID=155640 RepID=A0ACC1YUG4_MELAZ|nr:methylsterol monooxygenase 1-1-like [Melia azedarach]
MLEYLNLEAAEAAVGRKLTVWEELWLNYSAKKHDFILHFHNILFLFLFYSLAPLPYMWIELIQSKKINKYKIQPKVQRTFSDMFKCYKDVMKTFILVAGPLQILSYPTTKWIGIRTSLPLPSKWEMFWQLCVYFIIEDYCHYWMHRWLHTKWGYEKIHHVHHEYTTPIGFAAPYAHWAEIFILGIPSFLGPALVPGHIITYWLWFILRQLEAVETHSGYEFPWSLTKWVIPFYGGAKYHDYHHYVGSRSRSNFASVFTYCDYIYGTDKRD